MKIHPVVAKLFHADRQADAHDETNSHLLWFRSRVKHNQLTHRLCSSQLLNHNCVQHNGEGSPKNWWSLPTNLRRRPKTANWHL